MEPELPSSPTDETLFHLAGSRNIAMLDRHVALGRPILCRDSHGDYGAHKAAACGYIDTVVFFLDHGMDVNVLNFDDLTFGLVGARFGYFDILHLFLDRGGGEECLEFLGMNALQRSIFFGESDASILAMINDAEYSSMLTATTAKFGFQASHFVAHFGRLNVLRALVEAGADSDAISADGLTPFHLAAQHGHLDVLKYLHTVGVNVNALTRRNENAAHFAAAFGDVDVLEWLDSVSMDMHRIAMCQYSIITGAVEANQYECCRWLLEEGGYHHLLENHPDFDLDSAFITQNIPIARLLISHGASLRDPMDLACSCFHTGLLDLCEEFGLVSANCAPTALSYCDWDAFEWLVSHGHFSWVDTVFELLQCRILPDTYQELKRRGFDFHVLNKQGQNLFFPWSRLNLFEFLKEEGVDPNVVDVDGNCAWLPFAKWKRRHLIIIGACPLLDQCFLQSVERAGEAIDVLPDCVDIWSIKDDIAAATELRVLSIHAILNRAESLIVDINQRYPLALWAAAIVVEHGVNILKEFGIHIDFDELLAILEERKFTYLANRCLEEKRRSLVSLDHMQLL